MWYKFYRTPRCIYRRCFRPYYGYAGYYYPPYSIIGSSIQQADQAVTNTGVLSGLTQAINQTLLKP